jgi:hypothetical protein
LLGIQFNSFAFNFADTSACTVSKAITLTLWT